MNKEEWRKVEAWVYEALDLGRSEKRVMLKALLDEYGELGKEAAELVEAHDHISKFLEPPFWSDLQLKDKYFSGAGSEVQRPNSVIDQLRQVLACWQERAETEEEQ